VDAPGVRLAGPHFFAGAPSPRWRAPPERPDGGFHSALSLTTRVLHYAYTSPEDVRAKARRVGCSPEAAAAAAGNASAVKAACGFILDLDRDAFMAAAAGDAAALDFFWARIAWTEGRPMRCTAPPPPPTAPAAKAGAKSTAASGKLAEADGAETVAAATAHPPPAPPPPREGWCSLTGVRRLEPLLQRAGLLARVHGVREVLRGHERAMRAARAARGLTQMKLRR
jgi:hypothetical protein